MNSITRFNSIMASFDCDDLSNEKDGCNNILYCTFEKIQYRFGLPYKIILNIS